MVLLEQADNLKLLIMIVFPGLTLIMVSGLLRPRKMEWAQVPVEAAFYGFTIFILISPLLKDCPWKYFGNLMYFLIVPATAALLFHKLSELCCFKRIFISPTRTAWDYYFSKRRSVFIIVTMKSGAKVCGYYSGDSAASCFPNSGDIYMQYTYAVDEQGNPTECQPDTDGLYIPSDSYIYLEFKNSGVQNE